MLERAVFQRVGRQFVEREPERLEMFEAERDRRTVQAHLVALKGSDRVQFETNEVAEIDGIGCLC